MAKQRAKRRMKNEINASSMADIAFLLLIFFLVTTTIVEDKGILVKLPPWSEEDPNEVKLNKRNVYSVLVNAQDQLLVRGEVTDIRNLRENAKEFIMNPSQKENLAESPLKAVISLKNDRGTHYNTYLEVYNELQAAYNELWDEASLKQYSVTFDKLSTAQKRKIRENIPLIISEAEPTAFGEESTN